MAIKTQSFFPARVNMWFASVKYAADVIHNAPNWLDFGAPAAGAIISGPSAALTTGIINTLANLGVAIADKWGRGLTILASAACTRTFQVRGRDYLGQPMQFNGTMNGTTPVDIPKAYKYLDSVVLGASADTVTITVNTSGKLGLPYNAIAIISSFENYLTATAGTLTTGDATTPATAITTDTRGLWVPNGALNGVRTIQASLWYNFAQDNLYGNQHFFS